MEDPTKKNHNGVKLESMGLHPNSKMKFYDFNEVKTVHSSGTENATLNFMTRVANSFFMGSLVFYNRYSEILYEGD
jgi:hypothetical protein